MARDLPIIDFHCHHVPAGMAITAVQSAQASQKARWEKTASLVSDEGLLVENIETGDIDVRVVSTPPGHVGDIHGHASFETIARLNDCLAALVARQKGRVYALATVDAYDGDRSAKEVERAVTQLGLSGVFVDCAKGDMLIDAPEARSTLDVAARLGVPVFVHPVNPQPLFRQMEPYGRRGTLFARGTVNGAALIALVESGVLAALPNLRVVVTTLAFGGLAMLANFPQHSKRGDESFEVLRRQVFIDTMGFNGTLVRASMDILGPDNVIAGSDWPIVDKGVIRTKLAAAFGVARCSDREQGLIAAGNACRLLRIGPPDTALAR